MTNTTHADDVTATTIGDLPDREALGLEVAGLRSETTRLQEQIDAMTEERQALLTRMGRRAFEVAREHSWCDVARSLVDELGGVWPADTFTFTVTTIRTMTGSLASHSDRDPDEVTATYITESLAAGDALYLDDEWIDVYTHDDGPCHTVTDIRRR